MKRIISVFLCILLLLSLCSCGDNQDPNSSAVVLPSSSESSTSVDASSTTAFSTTGALVTTDVSATSPTTTGLGSTPTTVPVSTDTVSTTAPSSTVTSLTAPNSTTLKAVSHQSVVVTQPSQSVSSATASTTNPSVQVSSQPTSTSSIVVTTTVTSAVTELPTTAPQPSITTLYGSSDDLKTWVYRDNSTGLLVREAVFDSCKGGDPAEIVQITDVHYSGVNDRDLQEKHPSIMAIEQVTEGVNRPKEATDNILRCLAYASNYDQAIVTGDLLTYMTWGGLEWIQSTIWKTDPNALLAPGNHDMIRTWSGLKGGVADTTTLESRYQILQSMWKHDPYYTTKVIKNKTMVVVMDNGSFRFWDHQIAKLKADIQTARQNGYVMLLFYHVPLPTGGEKGLTTSLDGKAQIPVYNKTDMQQNDAATQQVYELIRNNADVIKGTFCGHEHCDFYTEIVAKTADGKDTVIPQYILGRSYQEKGLVLKITVK